MVIDRICEMTVKGVKLKLERFFSIPCGVVELERKSHKGEGGRMVRIGLMPARIHKEIFRHLTYDFTITSSLETMGKFEPLRNLASDKSFKGNDESFTKM